MGDIVTFPLKTAPFLTDELLGAKQPSSECSRYSMLFWIHPPTTMRTHTRHLLSVFAISVALLAGASPAQAQFGVAGGLNFESADDIKATSGSATLDNSTGYHVGLVYEFSLGPVGLRPGVYYRRVGDFSFSNTSSPLDGTRYSVSAWEVPVDLKVTVLPTPLVSPYIVGGPKATFPRGEDEFDDAVKDVSYTFNVGVGANISLPATSLQLQPELRYEFGASGFIEEDKEVSLGDNNVNFEPQDSPQFSTLALRLHILF